MTRIFMFFHRMFSYRKERIVCPPISVVLPVYNRKDMVLHAVKSVLEQTFASYQLIVVDDGSSEDQSVLQEWVEQHGGLYLKISRRGVSAARNFGVRHAKGRWIAFLDSDDIWLPEKLEAQLSFHEAHPDLAISQTEELWFRNGKFVNACAHHEKPEGEAFYRSLELCCISPSSVMLERTLFIEHGGFDEDLLVCEDYDLWLRITCRSEVGLLRTPLVKKHGGHQDQLSKAYPAMDRFRVYSILKLLRSVNLGREKRDAALRMISSKCRVLTAGANKRGRKEMAEDFLCVREFADASRRDAKADNRDEIAALLVRLKKYLSVSLPEEL